VKKLLILSVILVTLLAGVGTVSANLVTNGGFETPTAIDPFTPNMDTGLTGWSISPGNIDLISTLWNPPIGGGAQSIDLSGCARATISQDIITTPGESYKLTFALAGNPYPQSNTVRKVAITWGNDAPIIRSFDTAGKSYPSDMGWTTVTDIPSFQATTNPTALKFQDVSENDNACVGVALDNIIVEQQGVIPTPEFPSMALPAALVVGLIGAVLFIKSTKQE
jgi:choice-of-anchor C domain-containing protein